MLRSAVAAACLGLAGTAAACHEITAGAEPVPFALEAVDDRPLPAALDRSELRTIEVVGASLVLRAGLERGGVAEATTIVRITDAGQPPVQDTARVQASYTRSADRIHLVFPGGATHTLAVEDGGATLRTVAASAGAVPAGGAATGVLHVHLFRRGALIGAE
jgi:hypothetical protein